jgi:hypothetical protein
LSTPELSSFDYLRPSRGQAPAPQLAPVDYEGKSLHTIVPLKAVPGSRPEPMEPKLTPGIHRGPPAKLTSLAESSSSLPKSSLYPTITPGDVLYKLPPLKDLSSSTATSLPSRDSTPEQATPTMSSRPGSDRPKCTLPPLSEMYRSPSPIGSPRSQSSRPSTPSSTFDSPVIQPRVLPSLRSVTSLGESDDLSRKIGSINLESRSKEASYVERKRHSELILNLLIQINKDFKARLGTPSPISIARKLIFDERSQDVEMTPG